MRVITLLAGCAALSAADPAAELSAWAPYADDRSSLHTAENRPLVEQRQAIIAQAWALGSTRDRFDGLVVVSRDGAPIDGQAVLSVVDGESGTSNDYFGPTSYRRGVYARAGSDVLAVKAGTWQAVAGATALASIAGGPIGAWIEVGHSDERGTIAHFEAMLMFLHLAGDVSDEREAVRGGLCFRWPGNPLARTVQDDPWSFTLDLDWAHSSVDVPAVPGTVASVSGPLARLAVAWRFTNHLLIATQVEAAGKVLHVDGSTDADAGATATLALGATF